MKNNQLGGYSKNGLSYYQSPVIAHQTEANNKPTPLKLGLIILRNFPLTGRIKRWCTLKRGLFIALAVSLQREGCLLSFDVTDSYSPFILAFNFRCKSLIQFLNSEKNKCQVSEIEDSNTRFIFYKESQGL